MDGSWMLGVVLVVTTFSLIERKVMWSKMIGSGCLNSEAGFLMMVRN